MPLIISGKKTQTRRRSKPELSCGDFFVATDNDKKAMAWCVAVDVRLERFDKMTNDDARKEGFSSEYTYPKEMVAGVLASIYGRDFVGGNPWLWVVEFELAK